MNPKESTSVTSEQIEKFVSAYESGYLQSQKGTHTGRKKDAKAFASKVEPMAGKALKAHGMCFSEQRENVTELEKVGAEISNRLSNLSRAKLKNGTGQSLQEMIADNASCVKVYQRMLDDHGYAPTDKFLSDLIGYTRQAWSMCRKDLIENHGYVLNKLNMNGWELVSKPEKPVEKPTQSPSTPKVTQAVQQPLPTPTEIKLDELTSAVHALVSSLPVLIDERVKKMFE